jgi:uncharacterized protein YhaN
MNFVEQERTQLHGRLAQAEASLREVDINVEQDLMILRSLTSPIGLDDLSQLDVDAAQQAMSRLWKNVHEMRKLKAQISSMREALGMK